MNNKTILDGTALKKEKGGLNTVCKYIVHKMNIVCKNKMYKMNTVCKNTVYK